MSNTTPDPQFDPDTLRVAMQSIELATRAGAPAVFFPPKGRESEGRMIVTPSLGGFEITIGNAYAGTRGWYADLVATAEAVLLHAQTGRKLR